ncbi:hypothetical protein AVEN_228739-1 [Araneus ventricosus]|uniref:Uncharacterized protein n=1 Tax=Araneus ventricosus TaxID=182803 RepID=A0A4Y2Q2Y3_ARAVE|nr:hypothetical protein AVEN_228739-1 [Araneus ventricosus]
MVQPEAASAADDRCFQLSKRTHSNATTNQIRSSLVAATGDLLLRYTVRSSIQDVQQCVFPSAVYTTIEMKDRFPEGTAEQDQPIQIFSCSSHGGLLSD